MNLNETTGLRTNALVSLDIVVKDNEAPPNRKRKLGKLVDHPRNSFRPVSAGLPVFELGIYESEA